jgi:hypothetical protein
VSVLILFAALVRIVFRLSDFRRYHLPVAGGLGVFASPLAFLVILFFVLRTVASQDVREDAVYIAVYMVMGAAWIAVAPELFLPGLSLRDDFFERRNVSAFLAISGFTLGAGFCFAGGNIGDGPGWWVVLFCAILGTATLALLWVLANLVTHIADRITIDRDPAIGLRTGGFLAGSGLILGRAEAGDWHSALSTIRDFALRGWPVLLLLVVFIACERFAKPKFRLNEQAIAIRGFFPALLYLVAAVWATLAQGTIQ